MKNKIISLLPAITVTGGNYHFLHFPDGSGLATTRTSPIWTSL